MINLAIVVPSFNTKEYTLKLIHQLFHIKDINVKIIVIDNASSDGSSKSISSLPTCGKLFIIINKENLGFTKAINQGIEKGIELGCDFFCLMNTDVVVENINAFKKMCEVLDEYKNFGILAPDNTVIGKNRLERMHWINDEIGIADEGMWYTVMLPKRTIDRVGLLDEQFFLHCSDSDYSTRIRFFGYQYGIIKNEIVKFKHTGFVSSKKLPKVFEVIGKDQKKWVEKSNGLKDGQKIDNPFFPTLTKYVKEGSPFLTILTRHWVRRPTLVEKCKESVKKIQPQEDVQHLFIVDDTAEGRGLDWASKVFENYKYKLDIQGTYILLLDDDNIVVDPNIVNILREEASKFNYPDAFIFRSIINDKVYPPQNAWQRKQILSCQIGSFCYAVSKEFFYQYASLFAQHVQIGDFYFIKKAEQEKKRIHWVEKMIACKTLRESCGTPE